MDLKKTIGRIGKGVLLKQATNKIIPMDVDGPKLSGKVKLAGVVTAAVALVAALSDYFGG